MNRRGFTAIVDSMFFIVIISLAVTAMTQMDEKPVECDDGICEACDTLMLSRIYPAEAGLPPEDRLMLFSDLWALSLAGGYDGATELASEYFSETFPYGDVGFSAEYGGYRAEAGVQKDAWDRSVERSYRVEFGGELRLTLYR